MSENKPTPEQLQALLQYASKKLGVSPDQLADTVAKGDAEQKISSKLSASDSARFQALVSDKDKLEKMLSSPQAKQLMEKLFESK